MQALLWTLAGIGAVNFASLLMRAWLRDFSTYRLSYAVDLWLGAWAGYLLLIGG